MGSFLQTSCCIQVAFSRELYYTGFCRIQSITFLELFGPGAFKKQMTSGIPKGFRTI